MMNYKKDWGKTAAFFNGIIIVLCIAIAIVGFITFSKIKYQVNVYPFGADYYYKSDYVFDSLREGNYSELVNRNHMDGDKSENKVECRAVAEYFEAASFYKMYLTIGETDRAEECLARMNEATEGMGVLSYEKENIDTLLEIEP